MMHLFQKSINNNICIHYVHELAMVILDVIVSSAGFMHEV